MIHLLKLYSVVKHNKLADYHTIFIALIKDICIHM